jgi:hypothetical protein
MNDVKIEFATIRRKAEYKNCEEPKDQEIYKDIKAKLEIAEKNFNDEDQRVNLRRIWAKKKKL